MCHELYLWTSSRCLYSLFLYCNQPDEQPRKPNNQSRCGCCFDLSQIINFKIYYRVRISLRISKFKINLWSILNTANQAIIYRMDHSQTYTVDWGKCIENSCALVFSYRVYNEFRLGIHIHIRNGNLRFDYMCVFVCVLVAHVIYINSSLTPKVRKIKWITSYTPRPLTHLHLVR